jgi:hypothetical protein
MAALDPTQPSAVAEREKCVPKLLHQPRCGNHERRRIRDDDVPPVSRASSGSRGIALLVDLHVSEANT